MYTLSQRTLGLLLLGAIGVGLAACDMSGPSGGTVGMPGGEPRVSVVTMDTAPLTLTAELPGRTVAYRVAQIRPQVNGIIQERRFIEGDDVEAGAVLYQIDPAPYQAAYDQAKASLAVANANLPAAKSRAERLQKMVTARAASQQDADDAVAAYRQAEASVAAAEAALELARVNLSYTPIKAPIPGRIGRSQVTEGALVTAYQPTPLAVIQQMDPVYVDVTQATAELLRLQKAMAEGGFARDENTRSVKLVLEDGSDYPLEGELAFRDVTVNPATGSVTLRIVFPNPDQVLLPGMYVRAVIEEGVVPEAILAPQQGVTRNTRGEPIAWVVNADNTVEERTLVIDRAIGDTWLVTDGLEAGDRLIVEGRLNVRPGVVVNPVAFAGENVQADGAGGPALSMN